MNGTYASTSVGADPDFFALCGHADAIDVWFRVTAATAGEHTFLVSSLYMDTTLTLFSACGIENYLDCNDDGPDGTDSALVYSLNAGQTVYIRIAGNALDDGAFTIRVNGPQPPLGHAAPGPCATHRSSLRAAAWPCAGPVHRPCATRRTI